MQPDAGERRGEQPSRVRAYVGRPVTVGLAVALLCVGAFGVVADNVVREGALVTLDRGIDDGLHRDMPSTPAGKAFFKAVSEVGGTRLIAVLLGAAALLLLPAGQRALAMVALLGLLVNAPIDEALKGYFQRERPPPPPQVHASDHSWGFPSGHALGSTVGYGLLAYVALVFACRRRWARAAVVAGLSLVVLLIGFSRMYLHAHYLSQVLGGFAAGAAWLTVCVVVLEVLRQRLGAAVAPGSALWLLDRFAWGGTACLVGVLAVELGMGWLGQGLGLRWWIEALVFGAGGVLGLIGGAIYARGSR